MSTIICESCGKEIDSTQAQKLKKHTVCKNCKLEILNSRKKELIKKQWIPICLYAIPNILFLLGYLLSSNLSAEEQYSSKGIFGTILWIGCVYGLISAIIVVAKKKSFLKIGEAEATRVDVSDYGDTVYASSSATYSKTQWLKVIINIFIFAVIMIYILFLGITFYLIHIIKMIAVQSQIKKLEKNI